MNKTKFTFAIASILLLLAIGNYVDATAQSKVSVPKQEKLLNGMRIHFWPDRTSEKTEVIIRIHSGAAFDTQGNEGQTCLTAEAIFPNAAARSFFAEDLGGGFEITCKYDYVQITASSRPDGFLAMLETLASAITNPTLDKETTDSVKQMMMVKIEAAEKNASYTADMAAANSLFGTFPYGRAIIGTRESLNAIDFADLRFTYDRSFGADNATMAVIGNFDQTLAFRASRRFFGAWLKSDQKIPSTFKQPDTPQTKIKLIDSPEDGVGEMRGAVRGTARNAADNAAFDVLAKVLEARIKAKAQADKRELAFVRNQSNFLPGMMLIGISRIDTSVKTETTTAQPAVEKEDPFAQIMSQKITQAEFSAARQAVLGERAKIAQPILWLDADTYKIRSVKAEADSYDALTLANVQAASDKVAALPMAKVMLLSSKAGLQN